MASTKLIRYVTDQSTNISLGNSNCYNKPNIWLVHDTYGVKGDFGYIMKVCPPRFDIEYISVYLKYNNNFSFEVGGEVELNNIQLLEGDKVWLANQSIPSENGIYIVQYGTWIFHRIVDNNVFVDLTARAFDIVDGDLSREIIIDHNINFGEVGLYTINYHVLNSQGILSTIKRKIKVIYCNASIAPTGSFIIADYLIKTEIDTSVFKLHPPTP